MHSESYKFKKYMSMDEQKYEYWATYYRFRMSEYFESPHYTNPEKINQNLTGYDFIVNTLEYTIENLQNVVKRNYKQSKDNKKWYIEYPQKEYEAFKKLLKMINKNHCWRMFTKDYGVINQTYMNRIKQLYNSEAYIFTSAVKACIEMIYDESKYPFSSFQTLMGLKASEEKFLEIIWYYACDTSSEMADAFDDDPFKNFFNVLVELYYALSKETSIEVFVAQVYSLIKRGGVNAAHNFVKSMLDEKEKNAWDYNNFKYYGFKYYPVYLEYLASALSTLGAVETEKMVLQYMVDNNKNMSNAAFDRLNYLTNHNKNAPTPYQVNKKGNAMHIEVGSLKWREDDYQAFFDELKLQKRKLDYHLALREENIGITLNKGIKMPELKVIGKKISKDIIDEYDEDVTVLVEENVNIISNGLNEKAQGIRIGFELSGCEHLELFVHMMKVGKKLNIKFYTLFDPKKIDVDAQKQQALFLYKNLSPTVGVWESSVKETIQTSLQHLLNTQTNGPVMTKVEEDEF